VSLGIVFVLILAAGALAYVLAPLMRADALDHDGASGSHLGELRELHARQQMLLASLKDLEDDRDTDKIGDEDYARLKTRLSAQTIEVMQRMDVLEAERAKGLERDERASRPLQYPGQRDSGETS
jgi:hypothetical protein